MLPEVVADRIRSEMGQIDELFRQFDELIGSPPGMEPDLVRRTALAAVLHSFYTGVEAILLTVAKEVDQQAPSGPRWHRDLLDQCMERTDKRPAVISREARGSLDRYLAFRHFFRQAYSFVLRWEDMRDLVTEADGTWAKTKEEVERWLAQIQRPGG